MQSDNSQTHYDYIITGMGCAGLSLICHLIEFDLIKNKKILLIDKAPKTKNDRTWCSWQKENTLFESIVKHRWQKVHFHSDTFSKLLDLSPYTYKMIEGIDFYNFAYQKIANHENIHIVYSDVSSIESHEQGATVHTPTHIYTAPWIFNSIIFRQPDYTFKHNYLQHFKGWVIRTHEDTFNPEEATLMDFRVPQVDNDFTFVYVMPTDKRTAMVEYTLFSKTMLAEVDYEEALKSYIHTYIGVEKYDILHHEFDVIPMTDAKFPDYGKHIINIGTAGGAIKPSTGYGFMMIQRQCTQIVKQLTQSKAPYFKNQASHWRYKMYDSILFNVIEQKKILGRQIFTDIFQYNPTDSVLRFLDNEASIAEELKLQSTVSIKHFVLGAITEANKRLKNSFRTLKN